MPSTTFTSLHAFLSEGMAMRHIYQPVMISKLLESGGSSNSEGIAAALLSWDRAQLDYYDVIVRRMPGPVLTRRAVVDYEKGSYRLRGFEELSEAEREELLALCRSKVNDYLATRPDPWSHRRQSAGYISGTIRYEILKRARFRCELCGAAAEDRALEVDHILPRSRGGSDDESNLQALCYSCNAMKRDRDDTDFRGMAAAYEDREAGCIFCELPDDRVIASNELFLAIRDAYPVTPGHTLLVPKRHVKSPGNLFQPELNAMWALASVVRADLASTNPEIAGFNVGFNDGVIAGQTIMHAHVHVMPRRSGDVADPRGGVRGVIPSN